MHSRWRTPISASSFQPKVNLISRQNGHRLFFASLVKWNIHSFYLLCSTQIKEKWKIAFAIILTQKKVSKRSNVDMTQKNIKRFFAVSSVNLLRFAKICQIVISFQYLQSKDMYSGVLPNVCPTKISLSICISSDKLGQQHVKIWVTRKVFLEVISKEGFFHCQVRIIFFSQIIQYFGFRLSTGNH